MRRHSFLHRCLVQNANLWLQSNPKIRVLRCESIERKCNIHGEVDESTNVQLDPAHGWNISIRGLRLWCYYSLEAAPQQLWYLNAMPEIKGHDFLGTPTFEGVTQTVERLNIYLATNPLPGQVLTIEALPTRLSHASLRGPIDLDCSVRGVEADIRVYLLTCFRVFYVVGVPAHERLGIAKFVPSGMAQGSRIRWMELPEVMEEAGKFALNPSLRVTNFQTVRVPVRIDKIEFARERQLQIDNDCTLHVLRPQSTNILCIIGGFVYGGYQSGAAFPSGVLSTRTFQPEKIGSRSFEQVSDTLQRITTWLHLSGARLVFAETLTVPHNPTFDVIHEEKMHYDTFFGVGQYWITVYRLYCDGSPKEVILPINVMPKKRKAQSSVCHIL